MSLDETELARYTRTLTVVVRVEVIRLLTYIIMSLIEFSQENRFLTLVTSHRVRLCHGSGFFLIAISSRLSPPSGQSSLVRLTSHYRSVIWRNFRGNSYSRRVSYRIYLIRRGFQESPCPRDVVYARRHREDKNRALTSWAKYCPDNSGAFKRLSIIPSR